MPLTSHTIDVSTQGNTDCIDLTPRLNQLVAAHEVADAIVHLFVAGSTAGLTTIEFEPGCVADLATMFDGIAPPDANYQHHERWGDHNGHSHMRASLMGPHLSIPVVDGALALGTWQQVILVDFDDRPRQRAVIAQIQS